MPRKTIPIHKMEQLQAEKKAVVLTTGFNQQIAYVKGSGRFYVYQRMLENYKLI